MISQLMIGSKLHRYDMSTDLLPILLIVVLVPVLSNQNM